MKRSRRFALADPEIRAVLMAEARARLEPAIQHDLHNSRMTDRRERLSVEGLALREIPDDDSDVIEHANSN